MVGPYSLYRTNSQRMAFTILSSYNIFVLEIQNIQDKFLYIGNVVTFSFDDSINEKYNPDNHIAFYYEGNELKQCNEMCLT